MKTLLAVAVLVVSSLAAANPVELNDWFRQTADGRWFVTHDRGAHWQPVEVQLSPKPVKPGPRYLPPQQAKR